MKYFPLFHRIEHKTCLIVGGGAVALRRARALASAGAYLDVVAPQVRDELAKLVQGGRGRVINESVNVDRLGTDYLCIIAATNNRQANAEIAAFAKGQGIPINVADDPAACDFIFPAMIERGPLTVALSNSGGSPVLSRLVKQQLDTYLPAALGELSLLAGKHRAEVNTLLADEQTRKAFWERVLQGPIAQAVYADQSEQAAQLLQDALLRPHEYSRRGEVYLLGVGPGDPDLLTLRALRLLQQADVVVYDSKVSADVIALAKPTAKLLDVGHRLAERVLPQRRIHQLLLAHAEQGKRVARLHGGDPSLLGREGKELAPLIEQGIVVRVVPGITAAIG